MKFILSFLLFLALSLSAFADDYGFPNVGCSKSTLAAGVIRDHDGFVYTVIKFKSNLDKKRRLKSLKVRFYESQTPSQSLVYVLSGIGGDAGSGPSNYLASELVKNGHHALIIPSTFTEEFAKSYSDNGYVGLLNRDAFDLLELINQTRDYVDRRGIKITSLKMVGYSLGALTAAHVSAQAVANEDSETKGDIHFDKVLMINTPVDLIYGLRFLDSSLKYRSRMGFRHFMKLGLSILNTMRIVMKRPLDMDSYSMALNRYDFMTDDEAYFYVAKSLSGSLGDVVKASQDIWDLGILPPKPDIGSVAENQMRAERSSAISKISFEDYINTYVVSYYRDNNPDEQYRAYTLTALNNRVSLYAVEAHLKKNKKVYLMTNEDDFLLRGQKDVDYLRSIFGERATFYPRGGHMGNLWYKDNLGRILATLK